MTSDEVITPVDDTESPTDSEAIEPSTADPQAPVAEAGSSAEPTAEASATGTPAAEPSASASPSIEPGASTDAALERIERLLAENVRLVDRQTEITANLHAENQRLRKGELRAAQQGLVVSVLRVCDDLDQTLSAMTEEESGRRDLTIVRDVLLDVLAHNGVATMTVEHGEAFDGRRHRAAQVRPTTDDAAHRTVDEVLKPGHEWADGPIIRAADVAVLKYSPTDDSSASGPA